MLTKVCTKCKIEKPATIEFFRTKKRGKYGLGSWCRVCAKQYMKRWRSNNREHSLEYKKQWRTVNTEYDKQWYAKNREHKCEYSKQWSVANKNKKNASAQKRRAQKLQAAGPWTNYKKIDFIFWCAKKLEKETGKKYHVDHIYPLQGKTVSGLHTHLNLQVLEDKKNLEKHNKIAPEVVGFSYDTLRAMYRRD